MSDDEESPIISKSYGTPESKGKSHSKFKNLIDDIELKLKKPQKNNTNSISDTDNTSNNKPEKSNETKENKINANNTKSINKFNSFGGGEIKKIENKKKFNVKSKNQNSSLISRMKKEKIKEKDFINNQHVRQRNSFCSIDSINININININNNSINKNEKLRPATPGIRNREENYNNKYNKKENDKDKDKEKEKKEKIDPLYIPHIVEDPLDLLKQKIELILEQSNEEITNLSNKISEIDIEMENAYYKEHENFAKNLEVIYKEKEKKLRDTYKKYDFALYKMFKTYGEKNNVIYDEMMKDKVDQVLEIEQEFNNKKNKIKNNFNEKIEDIKKIYEKKRQEQDISNNKFINDIKKNIYNILYDKNSINKNNNNNKNENIINNKEDANKKTKKTKSFFSLKK